MESKENETPSILPEENPRGSKILAERIDLNAPVSEANREKIEKIEKMDESDNATEEETTNSPVLNIDDQKPLIAKLSSKHQLVLPLEVVKALDVTIGDYVKFEFDGSKKVRISKARIE